MNNPDSTEERRKHPRFEVDWPITVFTDEGTVEGEALNISLEGISICCEEPLPLKKALRITIVPLNHPIIQIFGEVAWADLYGMDDEKTTIGMGICFVEISDEDRLTIEKLVSSLDSQ
ncbi:PilZ domain-containing protein [Thermodesulfobacteriota bacterium]